MNWITWTCDNALTGEIPSEICNSLKLQEIRLNSNQLEGSIPVQISNLTSLKWLTLYENQLSGEIPNTIGNLKNLQAIRAGKNKNLGGIIPRDIWNCTELTMLGLAETSGFPSSESWSRQEACKCIHLENSPFRPNPTWTRGLQSPPKHLPLRKFTHPFNTERDWELGKFESLGFRIELDFGKYTCRDLGLPKLDRSPFEF